MYCEKGIPTQPFLESSKRPGVTQPELETTCTIAKVLLQFAIQDIGSGLQKQVRPRPVLCICWGLTKRRLTTRLTTVSTKPIRKDFPGAVTLTVAGDRVPVKLQVTNHIRHAWP